MNSLTITLEWYALRQISLMGLEELYKLIMIGSLMDNLRMENSMDTEDGLIMMVNTMNKNVKMVIG